MKEIKPRRIATGKEQGPVVLCPLRVAAYFQVDKSDNTTHESLHSQYLDKITSNSNWTLAGIFNDSRDDTTSKMSYSSLQRLLTKCRKGKIDRIIVRSMWQFSRNCRQFWEIIQELNALGISVYFEKENISTPEQDVLCTFMAELARRESELITRNSTHMKYMTQSYARNKHPRKKAINQRFTFEKAEE